MKRLIALFITATLLLGCLASCSSPQGSGHDGGDNLGFSSKNYLDTVAKWTAYLEFAGKDGNAGITTTNKIENVSSTHNDLIITEIAQDVLNEDQSLREVVTTTKWLTLEGKVVQTFVSKQPTFPLREGYSADGLVKYSFDYVDGGLILVTAEALTLKEAEEGTEPLDPGERSSYDLKVTYSYYFEDGSVFLTGLESALVRRVVNNNSAIAAGRYLLDSGEKTYLMSENNELLVTFDLGMEYDVPVYDTESYTFGEYNDYTYFEAHGYNYVITEEKAQMMQIGDLVGYIVPGMSLTVMDGNWNVTVSYVSSCYAIVGYAVMENGNVFICEYELLSSEAEEYDILSGTEKLNVHNKLIDVKTGNVAELELGFTAQKLFNETTKSIKSFTSLATYTGNGFDLLDTTVKDGYTLATVNKYEGGLINMQSTYAILDENLAIVAELPAILPDQIFYPGMISNGIMLVETLAVGNKMISYAINTKTGNAMLFPKDHSSVVHTNLGYLVDRVIYSEGWKELYKISESYTDIQVANGDIYCIDSWGDAYLLKAPIDEYGWYEFDYVMDFEYEESTLSFTQDGDLIVRHSNNGTVMEVYNTNGEELFGNKSEHVYVYSSKLMEDVECYKTTELLGMVDTEFGYLIITQVSVERNYSSFEESGIPDVTTTLEYYVLK